MIGQLLLIGAIKCRKVFCHSSLPIPLWVPLLSVPTAKPLWVPLLNCVHCVTFQGIFQLVFYWKFVTNWVWTRSKAAKNTNLSTHETSTGVPSYKKWDTRDAIGGDAWWKRDTDRIRRPTIKTLTTWILMLRQSVEFTVDLQSNKIFMLCGIANYEDNNGRRMHLRDLYWFEKTISPCWIRIA